MAVVLLDRSSRVVTVERNKSNEGYPLGTLGRGRYCLNFAHIPRAAARGPVVLYSQFSR